VMRQRILLIVTVNFGHKIPFSENIEAECVNDFETLISIN
jgi:hypothetical protein